MPGPEQRHSETDGEGKPGYHDLEEVRAVGFSYSLKRKGR